jgi:putative two-component system response regulator
MTARRFGPPVCQVPGNRVAALRFGSVMDAADRMRRQVDRRLLALQRQLGQARRRADCAELELAERLSVVAEYRDDDTGEHTARVATLSAAIGAGLRLGRRRVEILRHAAPLHDIGKVAVPDAILLKAGPLTDGEVAVMREHALLGSAMLSGSRSPYLQAAATIAAGHHERWDGGGYPSGLAGTAIPVLARIVAVADVYDALVHDRPYKSAWPVDRARAEIAAQAGRQFDPDVTAAFAALGADALARHADGRAARRSIAS